MSKNQKEQQIVGTSAEHLFKVAVCHSCAFPDSLSSAMGRSYLRNMLEWYLVTEKAFLFHIDSDNTCTGYCGGIIVDGTLPTGSASGMAQHTFWHAIRTFTLRPWLLIHPEVRAKWPLLRRNIKMRLGLSSKVHAPQQKAKQKKDPHVGLVVIGVDPQYHGQGYGSILLKEFERRAVEDYGIHKLQLTVLADNVKAIRAYERNGWQRGAQNGKSLSMHKVIPKIL